jgi:hypothetical protein
MSRFGLFLSFLAPSISAAILSPSEARDTMYYIGIDIDIDIDGTVIMLAESSPVMAKLSRTKNALLQSKRVVLAFLQLQLKLPNHSYKALKSRSKLLALVLVVKSIQCKVLSILLLT